MMILYFFQFSLSLVLCSSIAKYGNKTFDEWTWLTAHNSHINQKDNGVLFHLTNQDLDLDRQLKFGVRGFMFDLDLKKCTAIEKLFQTCKCEGLCLCHGQCSDPIKDGFEIKPFEYYLKKIVAFLKVNKEELVTIFLENYVVDVKLMQDVFNKIKSLNGLVFNPYASRWNVSEIGWPRIVNMIRADKRLLIIDDEKRGEHAEAAPGIIRARDFCIENHFEWFRDQFIWANFTLKNSPLENRTFFNDSFDSSGGLRMEMSRCLSWHRANRKPLWEEGNMLVWSERENEKQVMNGRKLFVFNHFSGVRAMRNFLNPVTYLLMNTREFILRRLKDKCDPGTGGKRANFIALDFIDENTFKNLIEPLNCD